MVKPKMSVRKAIDGNCKAGFGIARVAACSQVGALERKNDQDYFGERRICFACHDPWVLEKRGELFLHL